MKIAIFDSIEYEPTETTKDRGAICWLPQQPRNTSSLGSLPIIIDRALIES